MENEKRPMPTMADCLREPQVNCPCSKCHAFRHKQRKEHPLHTLSIKDATDVILGAVGITVDNIVQFHDCMYYDWPQKYIGWTFGDAVNDCSPVLLAAVFTRHIPYLPIVRI